MKGYLLDTNAVSDWLDATRPRHATVSDNIGRLMRTETLLLTSTIVLGEIEYGIQTAPQEIQQRLEEFRSQVEVEFVHNRLLLDVTRGTTFVYGDLRARVFEKYAPGEKRKKGMRPEELTSPTTSKELGIQENDLWIAAQAIERNLILVSNDAMRRIRDVAPELRVEDWGQPSR
ncbi:MAG: type II toxin-antitoxin system VapC family toxin [Phycisphaerae bacterium]|nr:type II toxin-antitoxin system VapC family toxin [Phycisphaerae bacterium]